MRKKLNENFMQRHKLLLEYSIRDGQAPSGDAYYGGDKSVVLKEEDPAGTAQGYQKKGDPNAPAPDAQVGAPAPAADPNAAPQAAPAAPADALIPSMDGVEDPNAVPAADGVDMEGSAETAEATAGADDPNETREDVISQLIQIHSDKLKGIEAFMQQMGIRTADYDAAVSAIPEVQAKVGQLEAQVEELTPDTPLQAMANVPSDLGGTTPEDWWNSYWADKNQNKQLASSPYYPQQKGDMRQQGQQAAGAAPGKEGQQPAVYYMKASDLPDLNQEQAKDSFAPKTSY